MFHRQKNQENYSKKPDDHNKIKLEGTVYLAYRDLSLLLNQHVSETIKNKKKIRLLDVGCGTGFSTKNVCNILCEMGFDVEAVGVDINAGNISQARINMPTVSFFHVDAIEDVSNLGDFDLITCFFVLLEMPFVEMQSFVNKIKNVMHSDSLFIACNTTGRSYLQEKNWVSFNNDFPENARLLEGNSGKLKLKEDQRVKKQLYLALDKSKALFPFFDYFHSGRAYKESYEVAGLQLLAAHKPLGKDDDCISWQWQDELCCPPYKIHILKLNNEFCLTNKKVNSMK